MSGLNSTTQYGTAGLQPNAFDVAALDKKLKERFSANKPAVPTSPAIQTPVTPVAPVKPVPQSTYTPPAPYTGMPSVADIESQMAKLRGKATSPIQTPTTPDVTSDDYAKQSFFSIFGMPIPQDTSSSFDSSTAFPINQPLATAKDANAWVPVNPQSQIRNSTMGGQYVINPSTGETARVTNIVDGDTIDVDLNGTTQRVRYVGVNTPEVVDPNKPVEAGGPEASAYNKQLLSNNPTVTLEKDQTDKDTYDRLLRYTWKDNTLVGQDIQNKGLATPMQFADDIKYPGRLLPSEYNKAYQVSATDKKILGKLSSNFYKVANITPLWANGTDNLQNKIILTNAEYAKKIAAETVPLTLFINGKFTGTIEQQRAQARAMAATWKDKDLSILPSLEEINKNGGYMKVEDAQKYAQHWSDDLSKPVGLFDHRTFQQFGSAWKETLANFGKDTPVLGEFSKGMLGGTGMIAGTEALPSSGKVGAVSNFAGSLLTTIVGFGLVGKGLGALGLFGKTAKAASTPFLNYAGTGIKALDTATGLGAKTIATDLTAAVARTKAVEDLTIKALGNVPTLGNVAKIGKWSGVGTNMYRSGLTMTAMGQMGLLTREMTGQEKFSFEKNLNQAAYDFGFGAILGSATRFKNAGQSPAGYAYVGGMTTMYTLMTQPEPDVMGALKEGVIMTALHGMGYKKGAVDPRSTMLENELYKESLNAPSLYSPEVFQLHTEGKSVPERYQATPEQLAITNRQVKEYIAERPDDPISQHLGTKPIDNTGDMLLFQQERAKNAVYDLKTKEGLPISQAEAEAEVKSIITSFNELKKRTLPVEEREARTMEDVRSLSNQMKSDVSMESYKLASNSGEALRSVDFNAIDNSREANLGEGNFLIPGKTSIVGATGILDKKAVEVIREMETGKSATGEEVTYPKYAIGVTDKGTTFYLNALWRKQMRNPKLVQPENTITDIKKYPLGRKIQNPNKAVQWFVVRTDSKGVKTLEAVGYSPQAESFTKVQNKNVPFFQMEKRLQSIVEKFKDDPVALMNAINGNGGKTGDFAMVDPGTKQRTMVTLETAIKITEKIKAEGKISTEDLVGPEYLNAPNALAFFNPSIDTIKTYDTMVENGSNYIVANIAEAKIKKGENGFIMLDGQYIPGKTAKTPVPEPIVPATEAKPTIWGKIKSFVKKAPTAKIEIPVAKTEIPAVKEFESNALLLNLPTNVQRTLLENPTFDKTPLNLTLKEMKTLKKRGFSERLIDLLNREGTAKETTPVDSKEPTPVASEISASLKTQPKVGDSALVPEPTTAPLPGWMKDSIEGTINKFKNTEIPEKVENLSANGDTAKQVAEKLKITADEVRLIRISKNIPSQTTGAGQAQSTNPEFKIWADKYKAKKPTLTALPKIPETLAAETPKSFMGSIKEFIKSFKRPDPGQFKQLGRGKEGLNEVAIEHVTDPSIRKNFTSKNLKALAKEVSNGGASRDDINAGWPKFLERFVNKVKEGGDPTYEMTNKDDLRKLKNFYTKSAVGEQRLEWENGQPKPGSLENAGQIDIETRRFNEVNKAEGFSPDSMRVVTLGKDNAFNTSDGKKTVQSPDKFDGLLFDLKNHGTPTLVPLGIQKKGIENVVLVEYEPLMVKRFESNPSKYENPGEKLSTLEDKFVRAYAVDVLGMNKNMTVNDFVKRANLIYHRYDTFYGENREVPFRVLKSQIAGDVPELRITKDKFELPNSEPAAKSVDSHHALAIYDGQMLAGPKAFKALIDGFGYDPVTHQGSLKALVDAKIDGVKTYHKGQTSLIDDARAQDLKRNYGIEVGPWDIISFDTNAKIGAKTGEFKIKLSDIYGKSRSTAEGESHDSPTEQRKMLPSDLGVNEAKSKKDTANVKEIQNFSEELKASNNNAEFVAVLDKFKERFGTDKEALFQGARQAVLNSGGGKKVFTHEIDSIMKNLLIDEVVAPIYKNGTNVTMNAPIMADYDGTGKLRYPNDNEVVIGSEQIKKLNIKEGDSVFVKRDPAYDINNLMILKVVDGTKLGMTSLKTENGILSPFNERQKAQGDQDADTMHIVKIGEGGISQAEADAIIKRGSLAVPFTEVKSSPKEFITSESINTKIKEQLAGDDQTSWIPMEQRVIEELISNGLSLKVEAASQGAEVSRAHFMYKGKPIHTVMTEPSKYEFTATPKYGPKEKQIIGQALRNAVDSKKSRDIIEQTKHDPLWALKQLWEVNGSMNDFKADSIKGALREVQMPYGMKKLANKSRSIADIFQGEKAAGGKYGRMPYTGLDPTIEYYQKLKKAGVPLTNQQVKFMAMSEIKPFEFSTAEQIKADNDAGKAVSDQLRSEVDQPTDSVTKLKSIFLRVKENSKGKDKEEKKAILTEFNNWFDTQLENNKFTPKELESISYWAATSPESNLSHWGTKRGNQINYTLEPKFIYRLDSLILASPKVAKVYYENFESSLPAEVQKKDSKGGPTPGTGSWGILKEKINKPNGQGGPYKEGDGISSYLKNFFMGPLGGRQVEIKMPQPAKPEKKTLPELRMERFLAAIKGNETSIVRGNVSASSQFSGKPELGRAMGDYRVTEGELTSYAPKYMGRRVTAQEFQNSPEVQREYMVGKANYLNNQGYTPQDIADIHNQGMTKSFPAGSGKYQNPDYVNKFNVIYNAPEPQLTFKK